MALLVLTLLIVPAWVYISFAEFNAANFWVSRFQALGKGYLVDTLLALPAVYLFFVFPLLLVRQSAFDFANARVNILTLLSGISLLILVTGCLHHLTSVEDTWTVYPPLSALKSQELMNMLSASQFVLLGFSPWCSSS